MSPGAALTPLVGSGGSRTLSQEGEGYPLEQFGNRLPEIRPRQKVDCPFPPAAPRHKTNPMTGDQHAPTEDGDSAESGPVLAERRFMSAGAAWKARFFQGKLVLEPPSGPAIALTDDEFVTSAEIIPTGLIVTKGTRRTFAVDEEARIVLRAWIEPFVQKQLAKNLRHRVVPGVIWAGLIALQNAFGVVTWSVYLLLPAVVTVVLALRFPRREIYLAEGALWLLLAANLAVIAFATQRWLPLLPAFFCALSIQQNLALFRFYAPTRLILGE